MPVDFASFRDPDGRVILTGERVLRLVTPPAAATLLALTNTPALQRMVAEGQVISTCFLPPQTAESVVPGSSPDESWELLEHERISFPTYPSEWPPEMLHTAASLTVEIALELLPIGFGIKDATPYNVLFRGPKPIFIDVLSFERRDPGDPIWLPYAQFVRTFLLPLAASRHLGLPLDQVFLTRRDGLGPEEIYRWLPMSRRIRPPFLGLASLPVWLDRFRKSGDAGLYRPRATQDTEKARLVLGSLLKHLRRAVNQLAPRPGKISVWSAYAESNSYSPDAAHAKAELVDRILRDCHPSRVLDVGANTGRFSEIAAGTGASVVAIDTDPVVVGELWRRASSKDADILPLVVDIARPTPSIGWRNQECRSFVARCQGHFDVVLMLAILHHLLVTERIPLPELIDLVAELTTDFAIVEWVGSGDPMFQRLLRGRDHLYHHLSEDAFQTAAGRRFAVVSRHPLQGMERTIYVLRKLEPGGHRQPTD